ncbi:hypothetical protein [Deinococcus altitudinis]|uniref:hypothetical protein n=1 Tax=Deinococcus altitudinis TaxID=468914 RepID=UPI003891F730
MSETLEALSRLLTRDVWLLTEEEGNTLVAREVKPETTGALRFTVRRVDVNSVSVLALRSALDEHELVRYAKAAAWAAAKSAQDEEEDGLPPEPDDSEPGDATMRAIATSVSMYAVLSAGMAKPTYEQAHSAIHGTALERALFHAILHWTPEVADPKAPGGS